MPEDDMRRLARDARVRQILKEVFLNGPLTAYALEKRLKIPHATTAKLVGGAYKYGLLTVASESVFRTGLKSRKYFLTSEGFSTILRKGFREVRLFLEKNGSLDEVALKRLDELAKQQTSLHPALKWWPVFRDAGPHVKRLFLRLLDGWEDGMHGFPIALFNAFSSSEEAMHATVTFSELEVFVGEDRDMLQKEIIALLQKNPKLRKKVYDSSERWAKIYRENLEDIKKIRKILEKGVGTT